MLAAAPEPDPAGADPATAREPFQGHRADRESDLFWRAPAIGAHEQLGPADPEAAIPLWRERMRAHSGAACLHLVATGGARPAAELYALPFVPAEIARERERFGAYATRTMGGNLLADLLQDEVRKRERVVAIDPEAVLLAAFAPRVPYQLMLVPRTPRLRFEDDGPSGAALLADALARLHRRLPGTAVTLWVRTAPSGAEHFSWRIDILPRLVEPSALELGAGMPIVGVAPERAARELKDA